MSAKRWNDGWMDEGEKGQSRQRGLMSDEEIFGGKGRQSLLAERMDEVGWSGGNTSHKGC